MLRLANAHATHQPTLANATTTKKLFELFKKLSLGNTPTMRATFTNFRGDHTGDKSQAAALAKRPSFGAGSCAAGAVDELSREDAAEISRVGLQQSADGRPKRASTPAETRRSAYRQPKPLELTLHSFKLLEHERELRYVLPGGRGLDLAAPQPHARQAATRHAHDRRLQPDASIL